MAKKLTVIINPASGKKDSILWSLNNAFHNKNIDWKVEITQANGDAYRLAKKSLLQKPGILAVYGGDGTVSEVARALYKSQTAMFILPGGTNNVIAKELGIPVNIDSALKLYKNGRPKIRLIDMAEINNNPFILRVESGIFAHMVKNTKRKTKRLLGQFSYPLHLIPHLKNLREQEYLITLDGRKIKSNGISLMVANIGNIGVEGYSIVPKSKPDDGKLDLIIFKEKPVKTLLSWLKSAITEKTPKNAIEHHKANKIKVVFKNKKSLICDDQSLFLKDFEAHIVPRSVGIVVP